MFWKNTLFAIFATLVLLACREGIDMPLPYPTPAQHDLVVLTQPGPLTYSDEENGTIGGLEHDLIEIFAQELGVGVRYDVVTPQEMAQRIGGSDYHIATAWMTPQDDQGLVTTPPIFLTRDVLVQNDASLPLEKLEQLSGKTVHVVAGSRQAANLQRLAKRIHGLRVVEDDDDDDIFDLLEALGKGQIDYVAMDKHLEGIANQFVPNLHTSLPLGDEQPIVWLLGPHPNAELAAKVKAFAERIQIDGTLAGLEDRYFGHVRRLTQGDIVKYLGQIEATLPKLRKYFQAAEAITRIDWRLLAAVAYQESHWDPNATSPTNVRGIMMLTEETADRLGVGNRLDPRESIVAGARYLNLLKEQVAGEVAEPDRTWMALAAYNLGAGHFHAGRALARQLKANPASWYEMKGVLPLLAKPEYYEKLKAGRARGGEAVIMVENIRSYYDILIRHEAPTTRPEAREGRGGGLHRRAHGPGLHLKR